MYYVKTRARGVPDSLPSSGGLAELAVGWILHFLMFRKHWYVQVKMPRSGPGGSVHKRIGGKKWKYMYTTETAARAAMQELADQIVAGTWTAPSE